MSLVTGLQLPVENRVAGLLVMSGYLPAANTFRLTPGFEDLPILHCHGLADPMVVLLLVSTLSHFPSGEI
jgi:predicted esterase